MLMRSLWTAISTYSVIPVPQYEWNEESYRYSICFFPVIGLFTGALLLIWNRLCVFLGADKLLFAAVSVFIPVLITGGIHMDGYMDTVDALSSHQNRERMLEIMKDHHCGAFAVIYCVMYFLLCFGFITAVYGHAEMILCIAMGYVFSRCLSGICAVKLPKARNNGMLSFVTKSASEKRSFLVLVCLAAASGTGMICTAPVQGTSAVLCSLLWTVIYRKKTLRYFGGVTGDTAGYFLQITELVILAAVAIGGCII